MFQGLDYDLQAPIKAVKDAGLLNSLCTIQQRSGTVDALGQVDLSTWSDVAGLVNIACKIAIMTKYFPDKSGVVRKESEFDTKGDRHIALDNYYPGISQEHSAVVDGTRYEIMAVEHASPRPGVYTRLAVRFYKL